MRTTGCNLRCTWCDTTQAFYGGTRMKRSDVLLVCLSGRGDKDMGTVASHRGVELR